MLKLLHHYLDPSSRLIRLIFAEYNIEIELENASNWKRSDNLEQLDNGAFAPILLNDKISPLIGPLAIIHHIEDNYQPQNNSLIPKEPKDRAEMWRLYDWIMSKFNDEITHYILEEKIGKREQRHGAPDPSALRAAKLNLKQHEKYFTYLFASRTWLGGKDLSLADFALASHISILDYLGDITWIENNEMKNWYSAIKSRPAFRTLLSDKYVGMKASSHYADLDF